MKIEILLGLLQNLSFFFTFLLISWAILIAIATLNIPLSFNEEERNNSIKFRSILFKKWPILIPLLLIALMPSVDSLWKIRISLIKLELASPENVRKGTEKITDIAHKLECKYLGCDKK